MNEILMEIVNNLKELIKLLFAEIQSFYKEIQHKKRS